MLQSPQVKLIRDERLGEGGLPVRLLAAEDEPERLRHIAWAAKALWSTDYGWASAASTGGGCLAQEEVSQNSTEFESIGPGVNASEGACGAQ